MDYRKELIREGKISHPSGKQEMIATGVFDDVDLMLSCHAMGIDMTKYHAEIGSSLNGFHHETRRSLLERRRMRAQIRKVV